MTSTNNKGRALAVSVCAVAAFAGVTSLAHADHISYIQVQVENLARQLVRQARRGGLAPADGPAARPS